MSDETTTASKKRGGERKAAILQALALMLEQGSGDKITTAGLARAVGVSEAALYRHFPSKAKMYDALFDFVEESLFSRITLILKQPTHAPQKCRQIGELTLQFADRNPGLCRLLTGDVLVGEHERLGQRSAKIMARLETQIKQLLREAEATEGLRTHQPIAVCANHMVAFIAGKILSYVRSTFAQKPVENLDLHWELLATGIFRN